MANQEEEVLNHLTADHAEGESDLFGAEEDFEADGFEAEDGMEADGLEDSIEADMLDFEGEDSIESEDAIEAEADAFVPALANALGAESEDAFFGNIANAIKKALPIVAKVARVAAPVLSAIPHPAAQVAARLAGMAGKLAFEAAEAGEGEDGVLQRAAEAAAEAAVQDRRARPVVVGLVSRQLIKHRAASLPPEQRRQIVRQVNHAAKMLTRAAGPQAIRILPKLGSSVARTADARGTSVAGRLAVLRRSATRVAQRPQLVRRLAQATPRSQRLIRTLRTTRPAMTTGSGWYGGNGYGRPRRYSDDWGAYGWTGSSSGVRRLTIDGPCTITVRPL